MDLDAGKARASGCTLRGVHIVILAERCSLLSKRPAGVTADANLPLRQRSTPELGKAQVVSVSYPGLFGSPMTMMPNLGSREM